jgi:hypothetical protein
MAHDEKSPSDGDRQKLTPEQRALWDRTFPDGIDRSRLTQNQLELWDTMRPEGVSTAFGLWEFGAVCALELGDVPPDLNDWMRALGVDPAWPLEYAENMRRKLEAERRERRDSESG